MNEKKSNPASASPGYLGLRIHNWNAYKYFRKVADEYDASDSDLARMCIEIGLPTAEKILKRRKEENEKFQSKLPSTFTQWSEAIHGHAYSSAH